MTSMVYTVLLKALRPQVLSHSAAQDIMEENVKESEFFWLQYHRKREVLAQYPQNTQNYCKSPVYNCFEVMLH